MKKTFDLSSLGLHIIAMGLMLCDHIWATVVPGQQWLTVIGRAAFPLFAFLLAEGYRHTRDVKKYKRRMLLSALVSEIPFNLMYAASPIYPFHQNVLWTFLIALQCMQSVEEIRGKRKGWLQLALIALAVAGWTLAANITLVDYGGLGVLMVLVFFLFPGRTWKQRLLQAGCLIYINFFGFRGQMLPVQLLGLALEIPLQGAAVMALIPIWLYRGRQGPHGGWTRWVFYGFYPVHLLILGLLSM